MRFSALACRANTAGAIQPVGSLPLVSYPLVGYWLPVTLLRTLGALLAAVKSGLSKEIFQLDRLKRFTLKGQCLEPSTLKDLQCVDFQWRSSKKSIVIFTLNFFFWLMRFIMFLNGTHLRTESAHLLELQKARSQCPERLSN